MAQGGGEVIETNRIYPGDCIVTMKTWPANFVDTIITDPPYGIGFMGKEWDRFDPEMIKRRTEGYNTKDVPEGLDPRITKPVDSPALYAGLYDQSLSGHRKFQEWCCAWATEALRIAKPGAMMLVSGGTRTFHRMTAGLEDAGWQIRDCLMWLYGSGFPKSLDISKAIDKAAGAEREVTGIHRNAASSLGNGVNMDGGKAQEVVHLTAPATDLAREWSGWGTALKPAWEPIIVAMKPLDGTFAHNAETWGVAGINVDGGRIGTHDYSAEEWAKKGEARTTGNAYGEHKGSATALPAGRWPANLILDEDAAAMLDGASGASGSAARPAGEGNGSSIFAGAGRVGFTVGDSGGASRFFYVAKSARAERNEGCEGIREQESGVKNGSGRGFSEADPYKKILNSNNHPTVKPLSLMKYLCMLTKTPTGGIVLDPFAGSGTTLWAAEFHNRPWIGIEMNPEYVAIAEARIARERSQMKLAI